MYTLKIESVNDEFLKAAQAVIQESKLWSYELDISEYATTITLNTMSIRELKYIVDALETEEFMQNEDN